MKRRLSWLLVPLVVILALGLIAAGCGSGTSTTTSATSANTTTTSAGSTTTAAGGTTGGIPSSIAVQLTGDQEVPPVQTPATGTFTLILTMGGGGNSSTASTSGSSGGLIPPGLTVSFKLEVNNITDATAAHIHLAAQGQNGPVIYPLFSGPQKTGMFSGVLAEGPLTEANLTGPFQGKTFSDLVTAVLTGQCYVNVHTVANPNGEIRGQIIINAPGTPSSSAAGGAGGATPTSAAGVTTTTAGSGY